MSKELNLFNRRKIGFRTDDTYKPKYSFRDMLEYEINELGNEDIFLTIKELYNKEMKSINDIIKFCQDELNSDKLPYKWLCVDLNTAKKLYYYEGLELYLVQVLSPYLVISDLGSEGLLVVSSKEMISNKL